MNPLFRNHPLPPRRPANPVIKGQDRMGLDQTGLAALLNQRATHWPMEDMDRVVGEERTGYPMGPQGQGFVTPNFIGPMPPVAQRTTPFRNEIPTRAFEGVMDPNAPVAHDEYQALVRRLFQEAQPGRLGSSWR
jgi:hypothetical protein